MAVINAEQAGSAVLPLFLDLIGFSEGTSTEDITKNHGYDVIVTSWDPVAKHSHEEVFTDYSDHPFAHRPAALIRPAKPFIQALYSTASGRYQVLCHYFEVYKAQLHLPDFGPLSQDRVALEQMKERGAIATLVAGDVSNAIHLCSNIWASFPGNTYGQAGKGMTALLAQWAKLMGGI